MKAFDQAKTRDTKQKRKPWYIINTKKYSYPFFIAPLVPFAIFAQYIKERNYEKRVWSEEKANKVLDAVLPKVLEYVEENNAYYYCMDWGTRNLWATAPRKYRKWAQKFESCLRDHIRDGYENADYIKTIEKNYYETWVIFIEK